MRLIKPSFEIKEQESGLSGIYKQIEWAGRHCYKSLDKITEDSAKEFVDRMIKSGHGAMLEHGTVYLKVPNGGMYRDGAFRNFNEVFTDNLYYRMCSNDGTIYITTNYRYIVENHLEHWLKYICEPTEFHERRVAVKFVCDRGVSHEFVRHRTMSFAQESTRYCNYSKDKFGNELTFIIPCWLDIPEGQYTYWDGDWCDINKMKIQLPEGKYKDVDTFLWTLNNAQLHYNLLINSGWKPQQARAVLPNSLKTELIMTGTLTQWDGFFKLRDAESAHPQARELAEPLHAEFRKKGWCE